VALSPEAEGLEHLHFHVSRGAPAKTPLTGPRMSGLPGGDPPGTCVTRRWTRSRPTSLALCPPGVESSAMCFCHGAGAACRYVPGAGN